MEPSAWLQHSRHFVKRYEWVVQMLKHGVREYAIKGRVPERDGMGIRKKIRSGISVVDANITKSEVFQR